MPDDLRRAVEHLEAPDCPHCRIATKWYRSIRVAELPVTIEHYFQCSNCNRILTTRGETNPPKSLPPGKLSRPFERRPAA